MIAEQTCGAHSAKVEMLLIVHGETISITHMGPDFLLIESPNYHPPANATIILKVDQHERRWSVHLPNGISAESKEVVIGTSLSE